VSEQEKSFGESVEAALAFAEANGYGAARVALDGACVRAKRLEGLLSQQTSADLAKGTTADALAAAAAAREPYVSGYVRVALPSGAILDLITGTPIPLETFAGDLEEFLLAASKRAGEEAQVEEEDKSDSVLGGRMDG